MAVKTQENLKFRDVRFISLNYSCSKPFSDEEIKLDVTPYLFIHKDSLEFDVIMKVNVQADESFVITTTAIGNFSIGADASEDYRNKFMHINAPAIMFPYIRAFLSTITSSFGKATGTIIIPAQTFTGDLEIINLHNENQENKILD